MSEQKEKLYAYGQNEWTNSHDWTLAHQKIQIQNEKDELVSMRIRHKKEKIDQKEAIKKAKAELKKIRKDTYQDYFDSVRKHAERDNQEFGGVSE